jgi:hypothetical protein
MNADKRGNAELAFFRQLRVFLLGCAGALLHVGNGLYGADGAAGGIAAKLSLDVVEAWSTG